MSECTMQQSDSRSAEELAGKYLTFILDTSFLLGMAKINDKVKLLLNIDKVLEGMDQTITE